MDQATARTRFCDWICAQDASPGADHPRADHGLRDLLAILGDDRTTLPAAARFCLPGCHVPTYAHAARMLGWLVAQDLLDTPSDLPGAIAAVPGPVLTEANGRIDDEVWGLLRGGPVATAVGTGRS